MSLESLPINIVSTHWLRDVILIVRSMLNWSCFVSLSRIPNDRNMVTNVLIEQATRDDYPLRVWKFLPSLLFIFFIVT